MVENRAAESNRFKNRTKIVQSHSLVVCEEYLRMVVTMLWIPPVRKTIYARILFAKPIYTKFNQTMLHCYPTYIFHLVSNEMCKRATNCHRLHCIWHDAITTMNDRSGKKYRTAKVVYLLLFF